MARNELERHYTYTDDYLQYIFNRQLSLNAGKRRRGSLVSDLSY